MDKQNDEQYMGRRFVRGKRSREYFESQINDKKQQISEHYDTIEQLKDLLGRQNDELDWFREKKSEAESDIHIRQTALDHLVDLQQNNTVADKYHGLMSEAVNNDSNNALYSTFEDMIGTMEMKIEETGESINDEYQMIQKLEDEIDELIYQISLLDEEG